MNDLIFNPIKINTLEIKNRIYMPAMHLGMASDYEVTDQLIDFYAERARGGAGMIVIGYAAINTVAGGMMNLVGAHHDDYSPGLTRLSDAVKEHGARCAIQINHAGANAFSLFCDGKQPVGPSDVPGMSKETPHPLSLEEIEQTIDDFAKAALRVKKAGFDAVEVLSAGGYLISQFLSLVTNKREDDYGGSFENRMRFGLEVMQAIRKAVGDDYPIIARISGNEFMPGGLGRKDLQTYAAKLAELGTVDAINVNVGWHQARVPQITTSVPRGMYAYLAKGVKENVHIPVIASHRINDPWVAREILESGMCDMVAMGRGLIADPYLPEKAKTGRENEIVHCIACAQGCFDRLFELKHVACLCNPKAGRERETEINPTKVPKKVMVVGGGAAGMSAALAAKEIGHAVTLYEKNDQMGGQLHIAGAPPGRDEFAQLARDLATQVAISDIAVRLNCTVDESLIEEEKPDVVILTTGAVPITLPVPGAEQSHVVQAWDVLLNRAHTGKRIVIIGGGAVGVETALFLAEKGTLSGEAIKFLLVNRAEDPEALYELATQGTKEIVLIEMLDKIGADIGKTTRWGMLQDMDRTRITRRTASKALEITETAVKVEAHGQIEEIPADTVVLAVGATSFNPLEEVLTKKGIPFKTAGDAKKIAQAIDAVHQGFARGREV